MLPGGMNTLLDIVMPSHWLDTYFLEDMTTLQVICSDLVTDMAHIPEGMNVLQDISSGLVTEWNKEYTTGTLS